ncbi:MAG: tyrosine-type recombinase/integrase [Sulfitobacter dubius]
MWKGGRPYYRRVIPKKYRGLYDDKTVWLIPLEGRGDAALEAEAAAHAHRHNEEISDHEDLDPTALADFIEVVRAEKENPEAFTPPNGGSPKFWKDGKAYVGAWAASNDPAYRRRKADEGDLAMSEGEALARLKLAETYTTPPADPELAELRAFKAEKELEAATAKNGETVISILPRWREREKQAPTTWKKHVQYVREFSDLHAKGSELYLSEVTKKQVQAYVEYAQTLTYRGAPLSPTSVAKRLDSVRALLSFAASVDEIDHNPATGVKAPKDSRPKTSRSWKSFEPEEIKKLVRVSTDLWNKRRNSKQPGRKEDLATALQCLIWTGARPEEICQLRREDIDLPTGAVHITNDETGDDARARLTKNDSSIRTVPIHSRLLPVLSEHLRRHNSPLLFPSFAPEPTPAELKEEERTGMLEIKGRYARPLSREWTDNLRELIAPDEPRKVLYSLRHSWAAESRRTGMPEHVRNALMGHADDNRHASRYGGDAEWLEVKREHVERMACV